MKSLIDYTFNKEDKCYDITAAQAVVEVDVAEDVVHKEVPKLRAL